MKKILLLLFCLICLNILSKAQLFGPEQVNVNLQHPPSLGLKVNKIAFNQATGDCSDQLITAIISDFVSNGIEVIDRENLKTILKEHDFNFSGYVDQSTAAAIGKILGPSALLTVKVLRCETKVQDNLYEDEKRHDYKTNTDYIARAYISRTTVFLKVSIQTADLTTGRIFAAKVWESAPVRENRSYEGRPEAPATFDVQEEGFRNIVEAVHRMYLPWTETTFVYFFDNNKGGLKEAYKALKDGNIDQALTLSIQNLENCKNDASLKDKIISRAYYNLGIMYFIKKDPDYDKALENLQEAKKLKATDKVDDAIRKCQTAKQLALEIQKIDDKVTIDAQKNQEAADKANQIKEASTLTNADIITLTQQKLPNSLIIQKIKTSTCKFDTSTNALLELTKAGVSEDVISVMMEKK